MVSWSSFWVENCCQVTLTKRALFSFFFCIHLQFIPRMIELSECFCSARAVIAAVLFSVGVNQLPIAFQLFLSIFLRTSRFPALSLPPLASLCISESILDSFSLPTNPSKVLLYLFLCSFSLFSFSPSCFSLYLCGLPVLLLI